MDYLTLANNTNIHVSKSNPNLINNEIQFILNNEQLINESNSDLTSATAPPVITSQLVDSPSLNKKGYNQLNLSNNSLIMNNNNPTNDENVYKANFYQAAKSSNLNKYTEKN
jgi:hypothetical protein